MTYAVLRTIAPDGSSLIHLPTAERIVSRHADYLDALHAARALRTVTYRHRATGRRRTYNENETAGCAWRDDQSVWRFVSAAELESCGGYALPLELDSLTHYEPKEAP